MLVTSDARPALSLPMPRASISSPQRALRKGCQQMPGTRPALQQRLVLGKSKSKLLLGRTPSPRRPKSEVRPRPPRRRARAPAFAVTVEKEKYASKSDAPLKMVGRLPRVRQLNSCMGRIVSRDDGMGRAAAHAKHRHKANDRERRA